jgi:predicted NUDIX family NTP pyrophosphohydrolase
MIPKGGVEPGETSVQAALREFSEETGAALTEAPFPLARIRQSGGKYVDAFALEGDLDVASIRSNDFELEWPRGSGTLVRFPEVGEARWMSLAEARIKMLPSQLVLLDALGVKLEG